METQIETPASILGVGTVQLTCRECGKGFALEFPTLAKFVKVCPACSEAHIKSEFAADVAKVGCVDVSGWHRVCPKAFQDTEAHKLPSPTKLHRAMAWQFGPKGLLFHGPTGAGKTRVLYEVLKREFKAGRTIAVLDHFSGYRYAEAYNESPASVCAWMEHKAKVDILALDDLFKAKLTDSFETAVFTIISQRTERGKPVLLTTNDVGATLAGRMSPDRGPALVRRLREFCEAISFS